MRRSRSSLPMLYLPIALLLIGVLSISCTTIPPLDPASSYRERLWAEIGPLPMTYEEFLRNERSVGPETLLYLRTYGFDQVPGISPLWQVRLGLLNDQELPYQSPTPRTLQPIGVLVGMPSLAFVQGSTRDIVRGTVFLVHGYLDHSGSWAPVITKILREGFIVIALDLPGHGLSGGVRGDIEDFVQYGEAVRRVLEWAAEGAFPRPWIGMGHSTGAAALWMELVHQVKAQQVESQKMHSLKTPEPLLVSPLHPRAEPLNLEPQAIEGLNRQRALTFDCVLFLSPLVRSAYWRLSMTLVSLTSWAIPYWKSRTVEDPLFPIPYFPLRWAKKLEEWEKRVNEYPILPQTGWIFQGTHDDVVDHAYSIPFLCSKLPGFQVRYIEGAGHVPYIKSPAAEKFIQEVMDVLSSYR